MQLSNGALKKSATPTPLANQLPADELEGVDIETFDLSAFVSTGIFKEKTAVAVVTPEIANFVKESEELYKLGEKFEQEVVQRGHQALYELLGSIYGLALRIEESPQSEKILEAIRKDLRDNHEISVKTNTTPIAVMVKYVIRADKSAATRYIKTLSVARQENISVLDLPAYITRRGGVAQTQEIESVALAKKKGDSNTKERTALIREFFQLLGMTSKNNFQYSGDVIAHTEPKEDDKDMSTFCVFVAHHVTGDQYKMISANDLGKATEDSLIKYLGKNMPNNLFLLESGIRNFKRRVADDPTQPESLRKDMERQLAIPMKYKQMEVIEMDDGEEAPV